MSQGSRLHAVEQNLHAIRSKVFQHPAYFRGAGSLPDDPAHFREMDEISDLRNRLAVSLREVQNSLAFLDLKDQQAFKLPREHRWSARQSNRDKRSELNRVYALAVNILADLEDLQNLNAKPSIGDILAWVKETGDQNAENVALILKEHKGHSEAVSGPVSAVQNVPLIFILALVTAYLFRTARR